MGEKIVYALIRLDDYQKGKLDRYVMIFDREEDAKAMVEQASHRWPVVVHPVVRPQVWVLEDFRNRRPDLYCKGCDDQPAVLWGDGSFAVGLHPYHTCSSRDQMSEVWCDDVASSQCRMGDELVYLPCLQEILL